MIGHQLARAGVVDSPKGGEHGLSAFQLGGHGEAVNFIPIAGIAADPGFASG